MAKAIDGEHGRPGAIATQSVGTTTDEVEAWGGWIDATYKDHAHVERHRRSWHRRS